MTQTHFGPQPVFSACMHRRIQVVHKGSRTFSEGEVLDNIQEQVLCLDCLKFLSESEVRTTWRGLRPILENSNLEETQ